MTWVLIILTIAGGSSATYPNLTMCQRALYGIETSRVREAYCVSTNDDRVYYVEHGKVRRLE